ncbi:MAG: hypothetical protein ABJE95_18900 [Byssovorax sp.]
MSSTVDRASTLPGARRAEIVEFLALGGGTLVLFPLAWLLRRLAGLDASETFVDALAYHAAVVINNPHFAVTYLLFYKDAKNRAFHGVFPPGQRARYVIVGLVVPLVLLAWAIHALRGGSARSMGLMIELMFFLVGWHYVKQGFGILTVFSARRGFRFRPVERAAVLGHCFAGWAYAWASPAVVAKTVQEKGVVYTALAHPVWLERITGVGFGVSAVVLLFVLARRFRHDRQLPPFAPLLGFLVSIWLWTVYSSVDPLMLYLIPALHSIQYGYVVWLLRRNQARAAEGPPLFGRPPAVQLTVLAGVAVALAWVLFRGAPSLLDGAQRLKSSVHGAPSALGETPYLAAIFVFVNIHHYFMDTVLWRRENPDTRHLLTADAA